MIILEINAVYVNLGYQTAIIILGIIVALNWKQNYNRIMLMFMANGAIIRMKTPSKKEQEFVVNLKSTVFSRRVGLKNFSYIIDATKMLMKSPKLKKMEQQLRDSRKEKDITFGDLIEEYSNRMTFIGKIPVLEYRTDDAIPIDVYEKKSQLSSEMLEGLLVASRATADMDFFNKLFRYKDLWKIAGGIAIGAMAAAGFSFMSYNFVNNNPLLNGQIPICQIAAESAKVIVAG